YNYRRKELRGPRCLSGADEALRGHFYVPRRANRSLAGTRRWGMAGKEMTAREVVAYIKEHGIKMVDLKFIDVPGTWQHATIPASQVDEKTFSRGIGFDGSSIRGFQAIQESDMLLMPDPATARPDPFCTIPTLSVICNVNDPITQKPYTRDPRHVAQKSE